MTTRLTCYSVTFIATLIYGSVIYHRHRRAKAHRHDNEISALDHKRYDRFYHGPYSENGIVEAHYQDSHSPLTPYTAGGTTVYGESATDPVESGGVEIRQKLMQSMGPRQELDAEGEVHELASASARSLKSVRIKGDRAELLGSQRGFGRSN